MKKGSVLLVLMLSVQFFFACSRSINNSPIPNTLPGKWVLTDIQAAGIGGAGIWSPANPAGQTLIIQPGGQVSSTLFPSATNCVVVDSVTVRLVDRTQSAGFRLFSYRIDTITHALYFYIRPPDGTTFCIEGCEGYKFVK